jgi:hypothetical protein
MSVPVLFEDYLEAARAEPCEPGGRCEGCHRTELRCWAVAYPAGASLECEACLRYEHGREQGAEQAARTIVGAAVAAAVDGGATVEFVRQAFEDAIEARAQIGDFAMAMG